MFNKAIFTLITSLKWPKAAITSSYRLRNKKPVHILFCVVDHYEPGTGHVSQANARERVDALLSRYPKLADEHKDHDGYCPKRTWFFPPHYHENYYLRDLVSLCEKGYGEIELHFHHGKSRPDTPDNLETTLRQCIEEYSHFGMFGTLEGQKKYAFIHGDWALANSRNGLYCGVNNELDILRKTGCFADFTFPSPLIECNPSQINTIFYANNIPNKPKSHNKGIRVRVARKTQGDLMIVQGPLSPYFKDYKPWCYRVYGELISLKPQAHIRRIDSWVRTGVSVEGKEDWIIIKAHMHGAEDSKAALGEEMDSIFKYLESKYNDGNKYMLHYVTARELYNIIKAAEAGEPSPDPDKYRNYLVIPPSYDSTPDIPEASKELKSLIATTYRE